MFSLFLSFILTLSVRCCRARRCALVAGRAYLPRLLKASKLFAQTGESIIEDSTLTLPLELAPEHRFHSIFICPVSKQQSTSSNPPLRLPCGHVVSKVSLEGIARRGRFKCPYCPKEGAMVMTQELDI